MHQHVLWGIDDGPQSREEMIALLRRDAEQGIGIVAATSHALPGVLPFDIELYRQRLKEAQSYCSEENLPLRVISGAEIRYTPMTLSMLLDRRIPTLGDSEYVLLEFWEKIDRDTFEDAISQLFRHGFFSVVAHAERYRLFRHEQSFLKDVKEKYDVYYQLNCDFALKRNLPSALLAHRLIQSQLADIWATDAHNLTARPPRMAEAFQFFSERKNTEALKMFVTEDKLN